MALYITMTAFAILCSTINTMSFINKGPILLQSVTIAKSSK